MMVAVVGGERSRPSRLARIDERYGGCGRTVIRWAGNLIDAADLK